MHGMHDEIKIPKCDYLFIAGDITGNGSLIHLNRFSNWISDLKEDKIIKEDVIVIAGNHDECLENPAFGSLAKTYLDNCIYLENRSYVLINGVTIFGSPYTPRFLNWFFMHDKDEMYGRVWQHVPEDTNIILSHGPAYGILDEVDNRYSTEDRHVGCKGLRQRALELPNLKYVIHGHIHGGYGKEHTVGTALHPGKIQFINCSICNEDYHPVNQPIIIEV